MGIGGDPGPHTRLPAVAMNFDYSNGNSNFWRANRIRESRSRLSYKKDIHSAWISGVIGYVIDF